MKIKIRNFRSLQDTGFIDIKPITMLVGGNGTGKSSFLRTFPLLKQSMEERTKSPILLYGSIVDFGSYKDIMPIFCKENDRYSISFGLDAKLLEFVHSRYGHLKSEDVKLRCNQFETEYSLEFREDNKNVLHIASIEIKIPDTTVLIELDSDKKILKTFKVNGNSVFEPTETDIHYFEFGRLAVEFFTVQTKSRKIVEDVQKIQRTIAAESLVKDKIIEKLAKHTTANTLPHTLWSIVKNIALDSDDVVLKQLQEISYPLKWKKNAKNWTTNSEEFQGIKELFVAYKVLEGFLSGIAMYLSLVFSQTKYLAPLRATAERYYRIQPLAINEVDSNGKNLPIFLDSLSDQQIHEFQAWTLNNFGFKVKIQKSEGHYSIKVVHANDYDINLSDMGFGYSQILPILTQLWYSASSHSKRNDRYRIPVHLPKIISIEQPELHLHPEFQSRFADAMIKIIELSKESGINLKIVAETHSDIIINRLGDCILNKSINANDINIVCFSKDDINSPSTVQVSGFDEEGNLINWPLGFFQPSYR